MKVDKPFPEEKGGNVSIKSYPTISVQRSI